MANEVDHNVTDAAAVLASAECPFSSPPQISHDTRDEH
ncbi:hypothetical protein DLM_0505 [Aquitalea magnusonii]|uniref:Uncharacterized protein n=1 Tax=Aquitalea magnusonii TaxID=332411 RepID=A0A3G9GF56_9NEIS|nr:hypothetical protein DLM_0505 [Aquitalea magnusonii]